MDQPKIYTYSSQKKKEYYEAFKKKNIDKISNKVNCAICGGNYTYYSKASHLKSKKHLFCENIKNII